MKSLGGYVQGCGLCERASGGSVQPGVKTSSIQSTLTAKGRLPSSPGSALVLLNVYSGSWPGQSTHSGCAAPPPLPAAPLATPADGGRLGRSAGGRGPHA